MNPKPLEEMDEAEVKAAFISASQSIEHVKSALREYPQNVRLKERLGTLLRDKFAIDPVTGKRLGRRNSRDLIELARRA